MKKSNPKLEFIILLVLVYLVFVIVVGLGLACINLEKGNKNSVAFEVIPTELAEVVVTNIPTPTPSDTPTPTPYVTPVPSVDATWYIERNEQIKGFLKKDRTDLSTEEIDSKVATMYIDPSKPMVALTFDDGPFPGITDRILDILEKYNVRATFFVCGWRYKDEAAKDITKRALTLGCEIGNHTYAHHDMATHTSTENLQSIKSNEETVFEFTGYNMHSIRPPGGHNAYEANSYAKKNNMAIVLWSQSGNVHEQDPSKIAQNVEKQIVNGKELQDGDIILLHDTKPYMVDAVEIIVPRLLEQGYQLVTVWELLNCSEAGFQAGETYKKQDLG